MSISMIRIFEALSMVGIAVILATFTAVVFRPVSKKAGRL